MIKLRKRRKVLSRVSVLVLACFLFQLGLPSAMALTSGPAQPEFSSFEPVVTSNMVNEYTGDFMYNLPVLEIPGPNGSGYAMSLSYHSGTTPEEESSWVGYGWTLNPGAINRNKRGFADDWRGKDVKFWNKAPANTTFTLTASGDLELFSNLGLNAGGSLRLNNYTGFATSTSFGLSFAGAVSIGYTFEGGDGSFSLDVNPMGLINAAKGNKKKGSKDPNVNNSEDKKQKRSKKSKGTSSSKKGSKFLSKMKSIAAGIANSAGQNLTGGYGLLTYNSHQWPDAVSEYTGVSVTLSAGAIGTPAQVEIGLGGSVSGNINFQVNDPNKVEQAYGYLYSDAAKENEIFSLFQLSNVQDGMMDYYVEKGDAYARRDLFIGMPFNNVDEFSVSGEGVGGGFRAYNKSMGSYAPNYANSHTVNVAIGIEAELGYNVGGGGNATVGVNELSTSNWPTSTELGIAQQDWIDFTDLSGNGLGNDYQRSVMRFRHDLGGAVFYTNADPNPFKTDNWIPTNNISHFDPSLNEGGGVDQFFRERPVGKSSYIGYSLIEDLNVGASHIDLQGNAGSTTRYRGYESSDVSHALGLSHSDVLTNDGNQIGEFTVVNENGNRYSYGLPVYNSNEHSFSVDLRNATASNGALRFKADAGHKTKVGQESASEYASTFLLTSITTPDYIDRNLDGYTSDDFGGYTAFYYERADDSYHWRLPYVGLQNQWNSLSDPQDDLGTYASGDKEVYYLSKIDTKTHYALFKTSARHDAHEADPEGNAMNNSGNQYPGDETESGLQKLDRIELYSKGADPNSDSDDKLIKVVQLDYDYEAWANTPNSDASNKGRLMLKKVWFESGGIISAKIAPYQFGYTYFDDAYPSPYNNGQLSPGIDLNVADEEPDYPWNSMDSWGNYQYADNTTAQGFHAGGKARRSLDQLWVDQNPPDEFDPAAWQLKRITLPSGGEIHVQYEQDDYAYVQNQVAHSLVSIKQAHSSTNRANDDDTYTLNLDELNCPQGYSPTQFAQAVADRIQRIYIDGGEKIFFKHLYKLIGNSNFSNLSATNDDPPWEQNCSMDYITGYCKVDNVWLDGTDVKIKIGSSGQLSTHLLPGQVCIDFVKTKREGMLDLDGHCDPTENSSFFSIIPGQTNYLELFGNFVQSATQWATPAELDELVYCLRRHDELSYFRVPVVDKLGGGLRVNRLLMYDPGMHIGSNPTDREPSAVYGTEYIYKTFDAKQNGWISSGVATSEPAAMRDESVLVKPLPRQQQGWFDRVIAGKDRKQMEGPLGESILPGPAIGYSQVITKNIHSGQTNPGFKASNFITPKDLPMEVDYTPLSADPYVPVPPITAGVVNIDINMTAVSQGFSFHTYDAFYGKLKSTVNYAGNYDDVFSNGVVDLGAASVVSSEEFEYFEPKEKLPVFDGLVDPNGNVGLQTFLLPLGREMDVAMESKSVTEHYMGSSFEVDVDLGWSFPPPVIIPQFSFGFSISISRGSKLSNSNTKIVSYPAVVKKMKSTKDQFTSVVENVAFDRNTGNPLVTRTYDEYNGLTISSNNHTGIFTTYAIPAGDEYQAMNQKAANERVWLNSGGALVIDLDYDNDHLLFSGGNLCGSLAMLSPGSLIEIHPQSGGTTVAHVTAISGNTIAFEPTSYNTGSGSGVTQVAGVHVLQSGKTNQLQDHISEFTTHGPSVLQGVHTDVASADPNFGDKQTFAAQLTAALQGSGTVDVYPPAELQFDNGDDCMNGCYDLNDEPITVTNTGGIAEIALPGGFGSAGVPSWIGSFGYGSSDCANNDPASQSCYAANSTALILNEVAMESPSLCVWGWGVAAGSPSILHRIDNNLAEENYLHLQRKNGSMQGAYQILDSPLEEGEYVFDLNPIIEGNANNSVYITLYDQDEVLSMLPFSSNTIPNTAHRIDVLAGPLPNALSHNCGSGLPPDNTMSIQFNVPESGRYDLVMVSYGDAGEDYGDGVIFRKPVLRADCRISTVPSCSTQVSTSGGPGTFKVNEQNGLLEYYPAGNDCYPVQLSCVQFCKEVYPVTTIDNVVRSEAHDLSDLWDYDADLFGGQFNGNVYQRGVAGKWRTSTAYAYKSEITGLDGTNSQVENNYEAGTYPMDLYNWKYPVANDPSKWLRSTLMTAYSPDGNLLEEENILGIKSCAHFGYNRTMPTLIAQNAPSGAVMFESFENVYQGEWENGIPVNGVASFSGAHTGKEAVQIDNGQDLELIAIEMGDELLDRSLTCKVWVNSPDNLATNNELTFKLDDGISVPLESNFMRVAEVGNWALYRAELELNSAIVGNSYTSVISTSSGSTIGIDDVVIHPTDASVATYVYDTGNYRLLANMDDQHFALLYQYSPEGKLIRKLKETERGFKTLKETYYNTPLIEDRPLDEP